MSKETVATELDELYHNTKEIERKIKSSGFDREFEREMRVNLLKWHSGIADHIQASDPSAWHGPDPEGQARAYLESVVEEKGEI